MSRCFQQTLHRGTNRVVITVKARLLQDDLPLGIEQRNQIGVGEITATVFFEFYPEQRGDLEDVIGSAPEEGPIRREAMPGAKGGKSGRAIAIRIERNQNKGDIRPEIRGKGSFNSLEVVHKDRTGKGTGAEEHAHNGGPAREGSELYNLAGVVHPGRFQLENGSIR